MGPRTGRATSFFSSPICYPIVLVKLFFLVPHRFIISICNHSYQRPPFTERTFLTSGSTANQEDLLTRDCLLQLHQSIATSSNPSLLKRRVARHSCRTHNPLMPSNNLWQWRSLPTTFPMAFFPTNNQHPSPEPVPHSPTAGVFSVPNTIHIYSSSTTLFLQASRARQHLVQRRRSPLLT